MPRRTEQSRDVSVAINATEYYSAAPHQTEVAMSSYDDHLHAHNIPYASPVFVLDPNAELQAADFWQRWKQTETTYAQYLLNLENPTTTSYLTREMQRRLLLRVHESSNACRG